MVKGLLRQLATAPDTQIDKSMTQRLKALSEQERPDPAELKKILDECAYAALASDFAMHAMDRAWKLLIQESNGRAK